jgi:hypothetical protein
MNKYFKTKKRLDIALENAHRIEGFEEYLHSYYLSSYDLDLNRKDIGIGLPYWVEESQYPEGEYVVELIEGYHDSKRAGDISVLLGSRYEYIDSIALNAEVELQADCGGYCHYYIGFHFLRVWRKEPVREVLISEQWGIYIPKRFLELTSSLGVTLPECDQAVLSDINNPEYWNVWNDILRDTEIVLGGLIYRLEHDGDLFLICD